MVDLKGYIIFHLSLDLDFDYYSVVISIMDYKDILKGSQESALINVSFSGLLSTLPSVELDQTGVTGVCAWEKELQIQSLTCS